MPFPFPSVNSVFSGNCCGFVDVLVAFLCFGSPLAGLSSGKA